jgi:VWFA-related protein
VADKRNGALPSLHREDFQVQADKRPQVISEFTPAKNLPLTVGLVVDASPAQREALDEEKTASATFFGNLLAEGGKTKAFVVQFGRDVDLLQDTTSSRDSVRAAIVMQRAGVDRASAERLLEAAGGRVAAALEMKKNTPKR